MITNIDLPKLPSICCTECNNHIKYSNAGCFSKLHFSHIAEYKSKLFKYQYSLGNDSISLLENNILNLILFKWILFLLNYYLTTVQQSPL